MGKVGRNELCPCGSGKKFKKCCINKENAAAPTEQISVGNEVELLQELAVAKKDTFKNIGVFIFLSTSKGDGWLLELTDKDALQVAKDGKSIDVEIEESKETIEVNWSHRFDITSKKFQTTAYSDKSLEVHENFPVSHVFSTIQKINKSFSNQLLDSIHVE